jgi:hypothetical protein
MEFGRSGATPRGLIEKQLDSSAYEIAEVYALRNEAKETFAWLARAFSYRQPDIATVPSPRSRPWRSQRTKGHSLSCPFT